MKPKMKAMTRTLILVSVLSIMTAIPAWAAQGVGGSPYTADLLVSGLNTGLLDPGQEYWYAYSRLDLGDAAYNAVILSLNFEAEGRAIASRVNFQVFDFEQVEAWLKDRSNPDSLGLGAPASADFDVNTGERFWAGPVQTDRVYYVRIFNLSPSPVAFRLTALGQKSAQIQELMAVARPESGRAVIPAAINVPAEPTAVKAVESEPETVAPPLSPRASIFDQVPVQPDEGTPASTAWLLAAQAINDLPPDEAAVWLMSAATLGWLPLGQPSPAAIPANPNAVVAGANGGNGSEAAVPADPHRGQSIYPSQPLRLLHGANTGRLAPKSEHWYTFTADNRDHKLIGNFDLTMFFTPGEPNLARHVTFELFTADQYPIWERGTPDQMEHFGAGSWVSRDGDYQTGERLWHGTVVDRGLYYVKLMNETDQWVDYHLMTGDIYNIEMGPAGAKAKADSSQKAPTGRDIGSPLPVEPGIRLGHLAAGQEIWFQFEPENTSTNDFEFNAYYLELRHRPGYDSVAGQVAFEIYPFQAQRIWRRGDTEAIAPLGTGSDFGYDRKTDTHLWLWDGHFGSNATYFIRLSNDSSQDIDYELLIRRR